MNTRIWYAFYPAAILLACGLTGASLSVPAAAATLPPGVESDGRHLVFTDAALSIVLPQDTWELDEDWHRKNDKMEIFLFNRRRGYQDNDGVVWLPCVAVMLIKLPPDLTDYVAALAYLKTILPLSEPERIFGHAGATPGDPELNIDGVGYYGHYEDEFNYYVQAVRDGMAVHVSCEAKRSIHDEWKPEVNAILASLRFIGTDTAESPAPVPDEFLKREQAGQVPTGTNTVSIPLAGGPAIELVWIPPGEFTMGCPPDQLIRYDDEGQFQVTLTDGFWIGRYEVTQEQWQAVTGSNPSHFRGGNLPVEGVSWQDCRAFLRELNQQVPGGGFRLPTEAEWEYAARAGATTTYQYGEDPGLLEEYAWFDENSGGRTREVGRKLPNAWGLYDVHGNVWEWCQDYYGPYPTGSAVNPKGPQAGTERVLRGGSWFRNRHSARLPFRGRKAPDFQDNHYGLRVVRDSAGPE